MRVRDADVTRVAVGGSLDTKFSKRRRKLVEENVSVMDGSRSSHILAAIGIVAEMLRMLLVLANDVNLPAVCLTLRFRARVNASNVRKRFWIGQSHRS